MKITTLAITYRHGILLAAALSLLPAATLWADTREEVAPSPPSIATVQSTYGQLPLSFEANHGQWHTSVQFVTRGHGHTLFLTPSEAVLSLRNNEAKTEGRADHATSNMPLSSSPVVSHSVVRMKFNGADPEAEVVGLDPLPGIVNYFIGDDPSKWRTNIPTYQKVGYKDLYPGIDLVYYGNQGHLEYDLIVAPGADPTQIMLAFDGAEQLAVDEQGDLILTLLPSSTEIAAEAASTLCLHKPVVYQMDEQGEKHFLAGSYVLLAAESASPRPPSARLQASERPQVAFQVAAYDTSKPLIIDPVLSWATYLGGSNTAYGGAIAVDAAGNAYVTFLGDGAPGFAVVTKLNAAGTAILYSTSLGGSKGASGLGIAVDTAGNAYVTGWTMSPDFPGTVGSLIQSTLSGVSDAFVTKLNDTGTAILYSTYLGGSGGEQGNAIAVDATGHSYVTGITDGSGFPGTAGSIIQGIFGGGVDAFVTKINEAGTALLYSTYLGGSGGDSGLGIAVDTAGNAYVTGFTGSSNFPGTAGSPVQSGYGSGENDAFITKLNSAGTAILYSTYLGGSGGDVGEAIAVDQVGQVYVTGGTGSSLFPGTASSLIQRTLGGGDGDAFVTKLNTAGTAILYSTYLGGSSGDVGRGIAVDAAGNAYVTGFTLSAGFPGTAGSPSQRTGGGNYDAFVAKLNPTGTAIIYSTYLGGSSMDFGEGIAVDAAGNAYVTGETSSSNFPGTTGSPIQSTLRAQSNIFVAQITSTSIINDLVTFVPLASTYRTTADPTECPSGFVGKFSFDARLTNKTSSPPLSDLAVQVKTLTNGNLLQNADGGNGGVGSTLTVLKKNGYSDGTLNRGESVDVHFRICLKDKKPFTFFVDVLGMRQE